MLILGGEEGSHHHQTFQLCRTGGTETGPTRGGETATARRTKASPATTTSRQEEQEQTNAKINPQRSRQTLNAKKIYYLTFTMTNSNKHLLYSGDPKTGRVRFSNG